MTVRWNRILICYKITRGKRASSGTFRSHPLFRNLSLNLFVVVLFLRRVLSFSSRSWESWTDFLSLLWIFSVFCSVSPTEQLLYSKIKTGLQLWTVWLKMANMDGWGVSIGQPRGCSGNELALAWSCKVFSVLRSTLAGAFSRVVCRTGVSSGSLRS